MIKAIIFDMDGVLVDSEPLHVTFEKQQFALNNLNISDEEHHRYMGVASDVMWQDISATHTLTKPVDEIIHESRELCIRYFSALPEIPVMPGLIDLLEELSLNNIPMAVASSSLPEVIDLILEKTGLKKYFRVIVSSQEAGKSKPEPDVFLLAAKKLEISPKDCLVIEDSANGINAAHAAGMSCIAYQGPGANPASQKEADAVVKSYAQLKKMF